jgi:hypothetical protein
VSGWAQHIDDLASSAAALLVEGPARPQPLVDARAALAARDAVLLELRALVGAVSDVPQIGEVRELTVFDIVHRSGQALHQALSELPRAMRFGSVEQVAGDDRKLPAYEQFWRRAAHATIGLEGYVDALKRLPDQHAWNVLRDLADVAAAIPYLDHDLSEALRLELTAGEDLHASYAQLTHPGHDALRLAAGEVRARVAATEPTAVEIRISVGVVGKQGEVSAGQVGEAMTRYAHAVSARGATLSVPDLRSVTRVLEAGCAAATQIFERTAPVVAGASKAGTGLRAVSARARQLREAPVKSMTLAHLELLRGGKELQDHMAVVAVPANRLPGGAADGDLRRLAWPAVQFADGVPALTRALEGSVREAVGNGLMLVPSVADRSNPTNLAWVTSTMGPERDGLPAVLSAAEELSIAAREIAPVIQQAAHDLGSHAAGTRDSAQQALAAARRHAGAARSELRHVLAQRTAARPGVLACELPSHPQLAPPRKPMGTRF